MGNKDEFESLIENFKLQDVRETGANTGSTVKRKAFDYDEDHYAASAPQRAGLERQHAAREPHENTGVRFAARPGSREEAYAGNVRASKEQGKRRSFQVNIDDRQFYEPSSNFDPPAQMSGGGGGANNRGGGNNGGNDDGEEPEGGGGGLSRWMKAIIVLLVVLGVSIFLALFALASASDLFGLNQQDQQIEFELPENLSMSDIAALLKQNGIISQSLTFQIYAGLKNKADHFIPGTYVLNSNMSYDEIMVAFKTGNVKRVDVTLMFYEGMTLSEIADKLEENKVCKKADLFEYLDKGEFPWEYRFLEYVPDDPNRFRRYEGYFFPDTYIFYENMSPTEVTRKFFSNFNNKIDDDIYEQMEKMDMTPDETIILASIIQREVGNTTDMGLVSSVFHNRLKDISVFPNLQSDTTREYVENDIKPYLTQTNQEMFDAYNSDMGKRVGLPVGPICNPGMDAIEAALNPTQSNYYFFVTDVDGIAYYATTDAEHEQNKAVAKAKGEMHGINVQEDES